MDESTVQKLSARVDRLDRENRRLKRMGFVTILSALALIAAGWAKLEDSEIILRDPNNNKVRMLLGTNPQSGAAGIQIFDKQGKKRIVLGTRGNDDSPGIFFFDENGNPKKEDKD